MTKGAKKPTSCSVNVIDDFSTECNYYYNPKYSFKDGKCYLNEKYYGDVIYLDENIIQVECKNGNKYMEGQIITMQIVNN